MCDETTAGENDALLKTQRDVSRRRFGAMGGAAALAALLPRAAHAMDVRENDVLIMTPDGVADCYFVHPASGTYPGVLVWPDILGLRPAFRAMGKRLSEAGHSVLVVNPYYRTVKAPVVPAGASFQDPAVRAAVMPLYQSMTPDATRSDAIAFTGWLDGQGVVDPTRKLGTIGYCMGGPMTIRTAAASPYRVGAAASFHGAGLVTDDPQSPHRLIAKTEAQFLIAIASNDDEKQPDAKTVLRAAFDKADLPAEIEVYAGALHGWCVPDSAVYNAAAAERAWGRLMALFGTALT